MSEPENEQGYAPDRDPDYRTVRPRPMTPTSEASEALPDIGPDPLKDGDRSGWEERLKQAYVIQQKGVRDQTALVWRVDLGRQREALLRARVLAERDKAPSSETLLREAAALFRMYEASHRAKDTGEGDRKAERNRDIAERIEAALSRTPPPPSDEVRVLREALAFYANAGECPHSEGKANFCIWDDGDTARAALSTTRTAD